MAVMPRKSVCPVCQNPLVVQLGMTEPELESMNDEITLKAGKRSAEAELGVTERGLLNKILTPGGAWITRARNNAPKSANELATRARSGEGSHA